LVVFSCLDTVEVRRLLHQRATYNVLPFIDLGVNLQANTGGGVGMLGGGPSAKSRARSITCSPVDLASLVERLSIRK
jgi:hypothetical protein